MAALLTLSEMKKQCRISSDDNDDMLNLYALSAQKLIEHLTGRQLFALKADLPEKHGWYASLDEASDLKLAMLMLVTHFYENPSASSDVTTRTVPFSVKSLFSPYIVFDPSILPII